MASMKNTAPHTPPHTTPRNSQRPKPRAARRPDTVSALDRGLELLQCFRAEQRALSSTDLAKLTGIPRPTVARLAATLITHRWLQAEPGTERYMLGAGVVSLAQSFLSGLDVRAVARAPMQALADSTGGSVYLAVRDGLDMVVIEACRARSTMLSARIDVGSRVPMPNSALGRAYLGAVDAATREQLLSSLRLARGSDWPALETGLLGALAERARTGLCLSVGEFHREINSVSVALRGPRGEVMAFNCGGSAFAFGQERLRSEVAPAMLRMAQQIAADIGGEAVLPQEAL